MTPRDDATEAQNAAARPDASTWLAANAGSGKTRVLTDRVARLLLDGVQPQHILCLTYTKAAASEMQNRLFKRLGAWAMLDDHALAEALNALGESNHRDDQALKSARTLFARAIETPGGLKIQTIHSFCASLLRRFPLEAGVSPQFTEIEDRAAELLRAEIMDEMAIGRDAALIADLAQNYTGESFDALTRAVVAHRDTFQRALSLADLLAHFDQPSDLTADSIEKSVFLGCEQDLIAAVIPAMLEKGGNDAKTAQKLQSLPELGFQSLPDLESVFLTGPKTKSPHTAKVGSLPTKQTQKTLAAEMPAFNDFMARVEAARPARLALVMAHRTEVLHRFAARFLPLYEAEKMQRGWLDFDDLIHRARMLLTDRDVAAWVLWRIDGGIDHILVDEAQDTSPAQWDVIRMLGAEFTTGQGARDDVDRTIFVVGDKKQSIYSFQGADPREFDRMQREFDEKLRAVGKKLESRVLRYSFRSSSAILDVVDRTFDGQTDAGFGSDQTHIAFKSALPGRVDLWPVIEKAKTDEERPWYEPLDRRNPEDHDVTLAKRIAENIKWMIATGQQIPAEDSRDHQGAFRPARAGDFLILVQRRGTLFSEIIRACKNAGLDIAGADKLKVGAELAVRDLGALLSFLSLPEDDLSLASALKSPLFGWSEQDLFTLAHGRSQRHLWQALRDHADVYPKTMAVLNDLRSNSDFLRPFDLIERILTRHRGRENLLSRLGIEAQDGINALLTQALAYESQAVPSLTGFLVWMETDELEIKRQIDAASDQIRVMTVHGAKGLEAPIVILPEGNRRDIRITDDIVLVDGAAMWRPPSADAPPAVEARLAEMKDAQNEERLRLLYVALTRAEKWLIVAAAGDLSPHGDSWYQRVDASLESLGAETTDVNGLHIKRYETGIWKNAQTGKTGDISSEAVTIDPVFYRAIEGPQKTAGTLSPSELGGAKALPGETGRTEEEARTYGTLVHRFLEHLSRAPKSKRPTLISNLSPDPTAVTRAAADEASAVLEVPELQYLFDDTTLTEVALTANIGTQRLHGTVDKLVVDKDVVLAVDFKTNATVPDNPSACPEGILRQLGAYRHALGQIYPDRRIDVAVLWTKNRTLMPLPHDIVMKALHNSPYLDDSAEAT